MRNFLCICLLLIGIGGCKPGIPSNIIQPERMEEVLYDIHITDGYISTIPAPDSAKNISAAYYKGIYKRFDIDSSLYARSMNYYYDHPEVLNVMYEKITAKLKKVKEKEDKINAKRLKKIEAIRKAKKDSLDKADPQRVIREAAAKKDSLAKAEALIKKTRIEAAKKVKKDSLARVAELKKAKKAEAKKLKERAGQAAVPKNGIDAGAAKKISNNDIPR
ncbi:hypothetical protein TH53_05200 [Pedobacter lusitanus]|uniref:DUF4296 domain-containing protein n=1 Tax=Pedobacter lusitanus TaxID=1503925 RepID=A0A0D0GUP1_9SPHI|nr:DUF4296 domain-containing protein [Pedobacter lusitanus]KIO78171.1 hypothetical protein TH53_05200 [Pedobacter lusitanus]